jgi:hypothetical protein
MIPGSDKVIAGSRKWETGRSRMKGSRGNCDRPKFEELLQFGSGTYNFFRLSPSALISPSCAAMCGAVLLGGVQQHVAGSTGLFTVRYLLM